MKAGKLYAGIFCLVVASGGLGAFWVASATTESTQLQSQPGGYCPPGACNTLTFGNRQTGYYFFRNGKTGTTGWQMPANTLVSTSFVLNQSINGFLGMNFNLIPFDYSANTILYLGLYVNGELMNNSTTNFSQSHAIRASMVGSPTNTPGGTIANFTDSTESAGVSIVPLINSLPVGTTITVTAYVTSPVWVETTPTGTYSSEATGTTPVPSVLPPATTTMAPPRPLLVQGDSIK